MNLIITTYIFFPLFTFINYSLFVYRINTIIIPCINSSSSFMKSQGALLLGAAASNNQKVQISALKADVIPLLLKHISDDYEFKVSI